ncbi:MAG: DUF1800 domain-containing protein [Planctomycetota bacterium]
MPAESTRREVVQRFFGLPRPCVGIPVPPSSAVEPAAAASQVESSQVQSIQAVPCQVGGSLPSTVAMARRLASRATFGGDAATVEAIAEQGPGAWLQEQLQPRQIDDRASDGAVAASSSATGGSSADIRLLARAVTSRRQLAWRTAYFWNNHFSTYRRATAGVSETQEDNTFFQRAFGRFADLLQASAKSPAMIDYLDSRSNRAGRPNENYARELLELHTLGVGAGYTEADVAEVARVFTGWSRQREYGSGNEAVFSFFAFRDDRHDAGSKTLSFGWSTPGIAGPAGVQEGESLLNYLAAMPQTAARIPAKLCRYFAGDSPTAGMLQRVAQAFSGSGGGMGETVAAIFQDPDFAAMSAERDKVRDGFEMVANLLRRAKLDVISYVVANRKIGELGAQPHQNPVPTGYAENGEAWQGAGNLLPRWNVADDFAHGRFGPGDIPWAAWFPTWPSTGAGFVLPLLNRFVDGDVPPSTVVALTAYMDGMLSSAPSSPSFNQIRNRARDLLSAILQLPEVQLH